MELSPSILSANFYNLENDISLLIKEKIKYLHLDVMDGMFVPNISFGMPVIKSIKDNIKNDLIMDVHLMVERPERYIEDFKNVGADILTIHKEATIDYEDTLMYIKSMGIKAGISIKPKTNVEEIKDVLNIADLVLIMSVEPGFGGQKFIESSLDKIKLLKNLKIENNYDYIIEVDGGINERTIKNVVLSGAELIVAGSSIFKGDIKNNINVLKNAC